MKNKTFKAFIDYIMNVFLSELQEKEIISILTGLNYGHIVDVKIDANGSVIEFVAENKKFLSRAFKNGEVSFKYEEIEKIGKDVILVKI